jgi:ParB family chromosome partitioning protein
MAKMKGLGRGLDALLGAADEPATGGEMLTALALDAMQPGRYQPRTRMDPEALAELAASIKAQGLMQPILVRPLGAGRYEILAGERRWRAARMAGLANVPVLVRDVPDRNALAIALIENLQREDLDAIEAARGFRRLIDEFGFSPELIATRVGRARSTVANTLRLLELAPSVQAAVGDRRISEGHARALGGLSVDHQDHVLGTVIEQDLSVRQTEELVRRLRAPRLVATKSAEEASATKDADLERVEEDLRRALGTKVSLARSRRGGRIVIEYYSDEELGRLYDRLTGGNA